jgi:hypothetical protein
MRLVREDLYDTAKILLELRGDPGRAEEAILEMRRVGPIIGAEDLEHRGDITSVRLLRFAVPAAESPYRYQPCELEPSRVWFPGLRRNLTEMRIETERTCATVATMREYVDQVRELETLREELGFLTGICGELAAVYGVLSTPEETARVEELLATAEVAAASD